MVEVNSQDSTDDLYLELREVVDELEQDRSVLSSYIVALAGEAEVVEQEVTLSEMQKVIKHCHGWTGEDFESEGK